MRSTRKLWALWFLLVFGLFNIYGPALDGYRTSADPAGTTQLTIARRITRLQLLGVLQRADSDTLRYFAYAEAMLGRPYSTYYVRPLEAWTKAVEEPGDRAYPEATPDRPLAPWRDFSMEYPPGMVVFALAPALLTQDFNTYHLLFALEMEILLTLSVVFAARAMEALAPGQGVRTLTYALAVTAALGFMAARRYDACVSLSLGLAILALAARRPAGAGAALALGIVAKGAPILIAPLGAVYYAVARRWRDLFLALAGMGAVCALSALAYLAVAGAHWRDALAYHGARPLQVESTYAALLIAFRGVVPGLVDGSVYSFGSHNIVSSYEPLLRPISEFAPLLATIVIVFWFWRAMLSRPSDFDRIVALAKAACAIIVAYSALGKVFSPQYMIWLTPLAAVACLQSSRAAKILLFAGLALTQFEFPYFYNFFAAHLPPVFGLLALIRNLLLIAWAADLLLSPGERESAPEMAVESA